MHNPNGGLTFRQRMGRALAIVPLLVGGGSGPAATAVAAVGGAAAVTAVVVVATPEQASAHVPSGYTNYQWGAAVGYDVWNQCYGSGCYDYIYESVTPTTFNDPNYCLTTQFDWERGNAWPLSTHYDGRIARSCVPNVFQDIYPIYESAGAALLGMQKHGQCLGYAYDEVDGVCQNGPNYLGNVWTMSDTVWCSSQWSHYHDGRFVYDTGGDPTDCYS